MQISRHWRMKANRYRLEGVRTANGEIRLSNRLAAQAEHNKQNTTAQPVLVRESISAAR